MQPDSRLAALVIACAGIPGMSLAQSVDTSSATVEQVIVTGSRVKRPEYEGNIPGVQTSAEQIDARNFTNAVEVLNDIPLVGGGATPNGTNGGQAASIGASFIDLLDLGTSRTLTLINSRRAVSGNAGSLFVFGNETGTQVDVNIIPTDLIERVDVLLVGGAAAYGSDAIAGVVNYILKDDFEGMKLATRVGQTDRGDGIEMAFRTTFGTNFANDRGNVYAHAEYNEMDGIQANTRSFRQRNGGSVTSFVNGSRRNPNFAPGIIDINGLNNGAFLRAGDDGISGTLNAAALTAANVAPGGVIFNTNGAVNLGGASAVIGLPTQTFTAGNTQLIPGTPGTCNPSGATGNPFCTFAPTALPANVTAAQVFSAFGVTPPAGATLGQLNLLAINVLQANRPTAREYFAANPNAPLNAFLGTFVGAFPDIANTDPTTRAFLPRVAVPLRFRNDGSIEQFNVATLNPDTPSTLGGAVGGDGFNPIFNTTLRVQQERMIGAFGGHYDLNDNLRFFSENSYAKVDSVALRGGASANTAASNTVENAALIVSVNNPFLSDANRTALTAAGITNNFVLSRTNQDIQGDSPTIGENKTFRTVQGLEGDFELLGRPLEWDASVTYGRAESKSVTRNIKDVEFALAIDAAIDPTTGNIVCRSQLPGQPVTPVQGISQNIVRRIGPDGIPTDVLTDAVVVPTAAQIAACQPLNPFGFNQMSAAARQYVLGRQTRDNTNEQLAAQLNLTFPLATLPGGDLALGAFFEYREDKVDYTVDQLSANGRTRTAALAATRGKTETTEFGAEVLIPIFGDDWRLPGLWSLDVGGGVRRTTQDGSAPTFRGLNGRLVNQTADGDAQNITSLKFNYSPIESLRFRGEKTRAIRQPNTVELFLGGQPAFDTPVDPCSVANINAGPNPDTRRNNCIAAVIAGGIAPDAAQAAAFLQNFQARGVALQGTFTGNTGLTPEKADSWTVGLVFQPTFLPGLRASSDYVSIDLSDQIITTGTTDALNFCFDSAQFPNNSANFGTNTCDLVFREPGSFQLSNGFQLGFLNLAATEIRALNSTLEYGFELSRLFGSERSLGNLQFDLNYYHLFAFRESATGRFDDTQESQGSVARPRNESRLTTRYTNGPWTAQLTWQYNDHTKVFNAGAPATADAFQVIELPSFSVYDFSLGFRFNTKYRANFAVANVLDKNVLGQNGANLAFVDSIGRRLSLSLTADFE